MKNLHQHRLLTILCLSTLLLAGCEGPTTAESVKPSTAAGGKPQSLATTQMTLGGRSFTLEIADNHERRMIGLMHRDSMPVEHGMIFRFETPQPLGFWMKNTLINLDILYIDSSGKIVSIHTMYAKDLRQVPSGGVCQYAIELNEGIANQLGLKPGDQLDLPPEVMKAR